MQCLPNGDWTRTDCVEVYLQPGVAYDQKNVAGLVAKGLMLCLAGNMFKIFNRKRWTDNDEAVNQLGLLQACHGLLARVFKRWLVQAGYNGNLDIGVGDHPSRRDRPALLDPIADDVDPAAGLVGPPEVGDDGGGGAPPGGGDRGAPAKSSDKQDAYAELNAKNRRIAL
eukprot:7154318-Pyramimonas_sp.AAC.1